MVSTEYLVIIAGFYAATQQKLTYFGLELNEYLQPTPGEVNIRKELNL